MAPMPPDALLITQTVRPQSALKMCVALFAYSPRCVQSFDWQTGVWERSNWVPYIWCVDLRNVPLISLVPQELPPPSHGAFGYSSLFLGREGHLNFLSHYLSIWFFGDALK